LHDHSSKGKYSITAATDLARIANAFGTTTQLFFFLNPPQVSAARRLTIFGDAAAITAFSVTLSPPSRHPTLTRRHAPHEPSRGSPWYSITQGITPPKNVSLFSLHLCCLTPPLRIHKPPRTVHTPYLSSTESPVPASRVPKLPAPLYSLKLVPPQHLDKCFLLFVFCFFYFISNCNGASPRTQAIPTPTRW
jgi:hypothetical protein